MDFKEFFRTLQIEPTSDNNLIKEAYYKLSKQCHPDVGGTEEAFNEISHAYQMLCDPLYNFKQGIANTPLRINCFVTLEEAVFGKQYNHQITSETFVKDAVSESSVINLPDKLEPNSTKFPIVRNFYAVNFGYYKQDVIINYIYETHKRYIVEKSGGIRVDAVVDLFDALQGNEIQVETLFGKLPVKLPRCVSHGQILNVPNHPMMKMQIRIAGFKMPTEKEIENWEIKKEIKEKFNYGDVVYIEFLDHESSLGWYSCSTDACSTDAKPLSLIASGFFVSETDSCIVVSPSLDDEHGNFLSPFTIVKSCITSIKIIKSPRNNPKRKKMRDEKGTKIMCSYDSTLDCEQQICDDTCSIKRNLLVVYNKGIKTIYTKEQFIFKFSEENKENNYESL